MMRVALLLFARSIFSAAATAAAIHVLILLCE